MAERVCGYPGCEKKYHSRGYCQGHAVLDRRGEPLRPLRPRRTEVVPRTAPVADRFWSQVDKSEEGCWIWKGCKNFYGYGTIWVDGKVKLAHRLSLEMDNVQIDPLKQVDHMCHNRACVRQDHLRVVEPWENSQNRPGNVRAKSGLRGVHVAGNKWKAAIKLRGVNHNLGLFSTPEEAYEVVQAFVKANGIIWDTRELLPSYQEALPAS